MEELNILFTSAGRRSYLIRWFKEALIKEGKRGAIFAANSDGFAPALLEADRKVITPLIYDDNYIPFLVDYCGGNSITAIISLLDTDLPILSRHRDQFTAVGTKLLLADTQMLKVCNDKYATYQFLRENDIHASRTWLNLQDAEEAIKNGEISFPVIVKPRWGTGSISVQIANDFDELRFLYRFTRSKVMDSFLKYESAQDVSQCVVIQEFLFGEEYGIDVINDLEGVFVNAIVKKKLAMRSGETDIAVTVHNEQLLASGEKLGRLLKHPGVLDVDAFMIDGDVYILEMNARFGGGYPFSHIAGADVPRAIVRWLSGKGASKEFCSAQTDVVAQKDIMMIRYDV